LLRNVIFGWRIHSFALFESQQQALTGWRAACGRTAFALFFKCARQLWGLIIERISNKRFGEARRLHGPSKRGQPLPDSNMSVKQFMYADEQRLVACGRYHPPISSDSSRAPFIGCLN